MKKRMFAILSMLLLLPLAAMSCSSDEPPTPSPSTTIPSTTSPSPSVSVSTTPAASPTTTSPATSVSSSPSPTASPAPEGPISEEVSWNIGETTVAATITRPNDSAVHPGIVFVPGSGPTDRDWNTPLLPGTNGSAKLLATEMAKQGYVTIRYDKRFTGPNAQKNLPLLTGKISFESHLEELSGAVSQLTSRPYVDPARVYVIANSEGTIHSVKYQTEKTPPFAGLILIGMPGRNMADVMHSQIEAQVASLPNAKEIMAGYDQMMADFLAGKPFVANPAVPEGISQLMQGLYAPINLPFTRELFSTDAAPLLGKITAPVLVMIGKKDIQVDWQADGSVLEKAAQGKTNVTFSYPENANHVLKNEPKPRSELSAADGVTYNAADKILDADALKTIEEWLASQSQNPRKE